MSKGVRGKGLVDCVKAGVVRDRVKLGVVRDLGMSKSRCGQGVVNELKWVRFGRCRFSKTGVVGT